MGSQKDVMELFAERDLRHMLPQYDGWTIEKVQGCKTPGLFYRVSRSKWVGTEVAFIAVSLDEVPTDEMINALDSLPDGRRSLTKKYLLTPQATDTSGVPPHVRVLLMTAFAFVNRELLWLTKKKNAKRFIVPEPAVAS
ncbi:MAG: hypothetical protein LUQ66_04755 [Methanoregula sp.]|nr:hypothetical protein [Methanoregula sp.]